jgi:beta-phosphoglucomutase-like phosphatase (HAD superfamily)
VRRFELVIFDCDGVLIDSEPIVNRAHAETLAACGIAIGFCGGSHCRPEHAARLLARGAAAAGADMRMLPALIAGLHG